MDAPLPPVVPPLTREDLESRINVALADNNAQAITPEDIRSRLLEMVDSGVLIAESGDLVGPPGPPGSAGPPGPPGPAAPSAYFTPLEFAGVGDGVADDTGALNAMFSALRNAANVVPNDDTALQRYGRFVVDGLGRNYRITSSINATTIDATAPVEISDLTLVWQGGTGEAVLDLTGSRHTHWTGVHVWNTAAFPALIGWQQARDGSGDVSAGHRFINCSVKGYYTRAGWLNYASEVCAYIGCSVWNYSNAANSYAFVLESGPLIAPVSSFSSLGTAEDGMTITNFTECEFRRGPASVDPTAAALFLSGPTGLRMSNCYAVSYGSWCVVARRPAVSSAVAKHWNLQLHMEGNFQSNWRFVHGASNATTTGFEWLEHNCHATVCIFSSDSTGGVINFNAGWFNIPTFSASPTWTNDDTKFLFKGTDILVLTQANLPAFPGSFPTAEGRTFAADRSPIWIEAKKVLQATAIAGAVTNNAMEGRITTESLTTAAAASYTLTITNSFAGIFDLVLANVSNLTNTQGIPVLSTCKTGAGTVTIVVANLHAGQAFNGTLRIDYRLAKRSN